MSLYVSLLLAQAQGKNHTFILSHASHRACQSSVQALVEATVPFFHSHLRLNTLEKRTSPN